MFGNSWMFWIVAFIIGYSTAMICCCFCIRYGALLCQQYCRRKNDRQPTRTVSDGWHSETDEEGIDRSPSVAGSHLATNIHYCHASSWAPIRFSHAIQNVIKPFLWQFLCCCFNNRKNEMSPQNRVLMADGTTVTIEQPGTRGEEPGYEAPVPAVCLQNFNEPTQIYNIRKCKVQVIDNSSALQVFNLNRSAISFTKQGQSHLEDKYT